MSLTGWLPKNSFIMRKKSANKTSGPAATTHSASAPSLQTTGNPLSRLLFVTTEPVIGEALATFEKMVLAMKLQIKDILLTTLGADAISPTEELKILLQKVNPEVIVCLGREASDVVDQLFLENIKIVLISHPSEMNRAPALKKSAWDALKTVMQILGL